jgi:hypothetical protein
MARKDAHNERAYRRARAWLTANPQPCYHAGCDEQGSTLDHVPPLQAHEHVKGSGCCVLLPCCPKHNFGWRRRSSSSRMVSDPFGLRD